MYSVLVEVWKKYKDRTVLIITACIVLNVWLWGTIVTQSGNSTALAMHFLSVEQGDSQLVVLPGGVKILIDGGPATSAAAQEISEIFSPIDRYIDLVILSHPQLDHFGGLIEVAERYDIGAFLWNGREGTAKAFGDLMEALDERNVPLVAMQAGDNVRYRESMLSVLSPTKKLLASKELNDTSIVVELESAGVRALFTGDIDENVERIVGNLLIEPVDVLKVSHHGSKFSSSANFLMNAQPLVAVIGVGKNSYGHPTPIALNRLKDVGAHVYRTDTDGTVSIVVEGGKLKVLTKRE